MNESVGAQTLTEAMERAAQSAKFDLACGYPNVLPPDWIVDIVESANALDARSLRLGGLPDRDEAKARSQGIREAFGLFFGVPASQWTRLIVTTSGSLALARSVAALARDRQVVTVEPEMDVIFQLLQEYSHSEPIVIPFRDSLDDALLSFFAANKQKRLLLALSSPNNPTGKMISAPVFQAASRWALETDSALIVDQCFATVAPDGIIPSMAWTALAEEAPWVALWDTGKTFGIRHEKVAFMLPSKAAEAALQKAMRVVQFDLPPRTKTIFEKILRAPKCKGYLTELWATIQTNGNILKDQLADTYGVRLPPSTSFALVDLQTGADPTDVADAILESTGVALIPGGVFARSAFVETNFLRCSLGRNSEEFAAGATALARQLRG